MKSKHLFHFAVLISMVCTLRLLAVRQLLPPRLPPGATTTAATTSTTAAATAATSTTAAATVASSTTAAVKASTTRELTLVKAVVPFITGTLDALKKGDLALAKKTFQNYSDAWKGIEIYVKNRSAQLYDIIEIQNEVKAVALFNSANPKVADIQPLVEGVQKGYNDAIALMEKSPDYPPVLDEIAGMRIVRVNLNNAITALKANDGATAKTLYRKFYDVWNDVEDSVKTRSTDIYTAIEAKMGALAINLLESPSPDLLKASPVADDLLKSYNDGLKLLTDELSKINGVTPATKELTQVKAVVPFITGTLDALKKGDLALAKKTFQSYSDAWKGIEIYVKNRSAQLYDIIEIQNEVKAVALFNSANPKVADIQPLVEGVQKGYNDAIALMEKSPAYPPVLDEIAGIRIVRVNLNNAIAAIKANDGTTAKTSFRKFYDAWDNAASAVKSRNADIFNAIATKKEALAAALLVPATPDLLKVSPMADDLLKSVNDGLKLLTDELSKLNGVTPATKELTQVKAVVPFITGTLDALKKGDLALAKKTFGDYSNAWKGIEIYVKNRSAQLYDTIEVQNEVKAVALFNDANAKASDIQPYVEGVQKGYNDAIALMEKSPAYPPVLDEIAGIRIVRVNLNTSIAALKANDGATAKTSFRKFYDAWDGVENSVKSRNIEIYNSIESKKEAVVGALLEPATPDVAKASPLADELLKSVNDGLKLLTDELAKVK